MAMVFEWDTLKARANAEKHGTSFDEAQSVFGDPLSRDIPDPLHSEEEERWVKIGTSNRNRLLVVVYTDRDGRIRVINAREATPHERKEYETDS